jgi:hypothetical protein
MLFVVWLLKFVVVSGSIQVGGSQVEVRSLVEELNRDCSFVDMIVPIRNVVLHRSYYVCIVATNNIEGR